MGWKTRACARPVRQPSGRCSAPRALLTNAGFLVRRGPDRACKRPIHFDFLFYLSEKPAVIIFGAKIYRGGSPELLYSIEGMQVRLIRPQPH
jgi:hypothetical protein